MTWSWCAVLTLPLTSEWWWTGYLSTRHFIISTYKTNRKEYSPQNIKYKDECKHKFLSQWLPRSWWWGCCLLWQWAWFCGDALNTPRWILRCPVPMISAQVSSPQWARSDQPFKRGGPLLTITLCLYFCFIFVHGTYHHML